MKKASFWRLAAAYATDYILLRGLVLAAVACVSAVLRFFGFELRFILLFAGACYWVTGILVNTLYFAALESSKKQASLGKSWLSVKVYKV